MSALDAIRSPEGIWINTRCFREEADNFIKNGYYCPDPTGSLGWFEYWQEQLNRCTEGYSVGGARITGNHYFYLNFAQIQLTKDKQEVGNEQIIKKQKGIKKVSFPDFWDGDYNYFHCLEIAEKGCSVEELDRLQLYSRIDPAFLSGGYHMIVGKARRKGFSFKNASICTNIYNTIPDSLTIIGAFDKKYLYPEGTMGMASENLDFLNQHTGWAKAREFVNRPEHKKASYRELADGIQIEKGYRSQIMAITFKDNPDAARGKDAQLILFEEAGKFNNLLDSYMATKDTMQDGRYTTGFMVIFGTGGDMEGGTRDFAQMFMNPLEYDIMPFINMWDDHAENSSCGYFHPDNLNLVGFYDEHGNSNAEKAKAYELNTRNELRKHATSSNVLQKRVQEHGLTPSECFLMVSTNDFPVVELQRRLNTVKRENLFLREGQPGWLYRDAENNAKFKIDLEGKTNPLWDYKPKDNDIKGAVVIYEYPVANAPKGLYKIGHDPYRQSQAATSTSIGATYVYKGILQGSATKNIIVATYHGRPNTSDEYNRNLVMLAELYNTEVGYENEVTEVKSYFEKKRKLHLLALQPNRVISNNIKDSKVNRVYGIHMPEKLKDAGEKYIKQWLLTERDFDEEGNKILNLDTISDPGLLEELINYNRKGNFDRLMAFMILMMYLEEENEGKKYTIETDTKDQWSDFANSLFKRV